MFENKMIRTVNRSMCCVVQWNKCAFISFVDYNPFDFTAHLGCNNLTAEIHASIDFRKIRKWAHLEDGISTAENDILPLNFHLGVHCITLHTSVHRLHDGSYFSVTWLSPIAYKNPFESTKANPYRFLFMEANWHHESHTGSYSSSPFFNGPYPPVT